MPAIHVEVRLTVGVWQITVKRRALLRRRKFPFAQFAKLGVGPRSRKNEVRPDDQLLHDLLQLVNACCGLQPSRHRVGSAKPSAGQPAVVVSMRYSERVVEAGVVARTPPPKKKVALSSENCEA